MRTQVDEDLYERVSRLEEQVTTATDLLATVSERLGALEPQEERQRLWHLVPFDPQLIEDSEARRSAWFRLEAFVSYLNATYGSQRTEVGMGPRFIRAGWWLNPIMVSHLAALANAWVSTVITRSNPLAGGVDGLALLTDRMMPLLESICASTASTGLWNQGATVSWSQEPPKSASQVSTDAELTRQEDFTAFVDNYVPPHAVTNFVSGILRELNLRKA